ncbi:hypothetical protein DPMN_097502 [Dreissena polymorpha]|uniref:Uncharacterized protein n=1 Tax=Dreissena polymorpha TaxID=45954 RepID=A0A9D4R5S8_DREPO|nr:hypothetical protein DPMN_097502 [Dreissena polymorpha]
MHTKYEGSISKDIEVVSIFRNLNAKCDGKTDRQTDGQTDDRYMPSYRGRAKPPPSPLHFSLEPIGIQLPCVATWRQCIGLVVERLCTDSNVAWQSLPSDSAATIAAFKKSKCSFWKSLQTACSIHGFDRTSLLVHCRMVQEVNVDWYCIGGHRRSSVW